MLRPADVGFAGRRLIERASGVNVSVVAGHTKGMNQIDLFAEPILRVIFLFLACATLLSTITAVTNRDQYVTAWCYVTAWSALLVALAFLIYVPIYLNAFSLL